MWAHSPDPHFIFSTKIYPYMLTITDLSTLPDQLEPGIVVYLARQEASPPTWIQPLGESNLQVAPGKRKIISHQGQTYLILGTVADPSHETLRKLTHEAVSFAKQYESPHLYLGCHTDEVGWLAIAEAAWLSMYRFIPYLSELPQESLQAIFLIGESTSTQAIHAARARAKATHIARDLVNEPQNPKTPKPQNPQTPKPRKPTLV